MNYSNTIELVGEIQAYIKSTRYNIYMIHMIINDMIQNIITSMTLRKGSHCTFLKRIY